MRERTELQSILTRALLASAAGRVAAASRPSNSGDLFPAGMQAEPLPLETISERAHRFLSNLIILLLLELEGFVASPLNDRARARVRLGSPSRSRILAEWGSAESTAPDVGLFPPEDPQDRAIPPVARDPETFFARILEMTRTSASVLELSAVKIEEMIRWLLPVISRCEPEDDPVGWIHAHAQRHRLAHGPGHRLRFQVDRERGRSQGVLYTPPPLTESLVRAVMEEWKRVPSPETLQMFGAAPPRSVDAPTVLDPACGSGQFLLACARHLLSEGREKPEEILSVFRKLHGVDIDPGAATLASFNLSLQVVRALGRSQEADARMVVEWVGEQMEGGFPWFLGSQIHEGNALLLADSDRGRSFRWTDRYEEIFSGERPGFDLVIGNPPWVSFGLRDRAGADAEETAYLRRIYRFGAQYKLSLCPLFIELALRLARPGGLHGFLVPDSFFTGRHFSKIRQHILESAQPLRFCLVESDPWPGVHVGHTAFYCVRRLPAPESHDSVLTSVVQLGAAARRSRRRRAASATLFGPSGTGSEPVRVAAEVFRSAPYQTFRVYRSEAERRFVERMDGTSHRFEDLVETYSGLIARHGQEGVTGPRGGEFRLFDRSRRLLVHDPNPRTRWKPALHSGSEVEPFRTRWQGGAVYIPDDPELLRKIYKSGFDLERYFSPKVFLRQTGDRLVAARDDQGLLCLNNVHILTPREDQKVDLRFLCGLLMSEPIQRYYQAIALETGRPLAQVDLATVRMLPYPSDAAGEPYGLRPSGGEPHRIAARAVRSFVREVGREAAGSSTLSALKKAVAAGPDRLPGTERITGSAWIVGAVGALVQGLEGEGTAPTEGGRELLDRIFYLLFELEDPAQHGPRASPEHRRP